MSDIEVRSDSAVWCLGVQLRKKKTSKSCQGRNTCDTNRSIHGELVMIVIKWKQDQNKNAPLIESVNGLCSPLQLRKGGEWERPIGKNLPGMLVCSGIN